MLPPTRACRGRLNQVFTNLLLNAAQALPEGARDRHRVTIRSTWGESGIRVDVSDTGSGIPPHQREHVFLPFFTTQSQSSGLGLSLSRQIVQEHGGTLELLSEPSAGTTFRITLPVRGTDEAPAVVTPAASPTPARKPRLLVVDDDKALLSSYRRQLGSRFELTLVAEGRAALALLRREPSSFDAVLCDVMMPDLDGPAVYHEAVATHPALAGRFVFSSGGAFTASTKAFVEARGADILEKPIDVDRLEAIVAAFAEARR